MKTIVGLTYADLDHGLTQLGYARDEKNGEVIYRYPDDPEALILLPYFPLSSPVRAIDLMIVQRTVTGFGILDTHDFDLLLLRVTGKAVVPLTR